MDGNGERYGDIKGLLQTKELYQYILNTSVLPRESRYLQEIRDATSSHAGRIMITTPDGGQLMALLLKLIGAKRTIEIGVFTGYSLLLTALTIPVDGKITAIDINRKNYEIGEPIIKRAGVTHKIDFIESPAILVLDRLLEDATNEGSYDFAFVDADKINSLNYHERLLKLVRVGGLIVYDNTLWVGTVALSEDKVDEDKREVREHTIKLNKFLASDSRIEICQLVVGDGMTICRIVGS